MCDIRSMLVAANHQLNRINLPVECELMPLEVISIRYLEEASERKSPLYTPGTHRHTYYEVHLPISGEQTYQLNSDFITVHAEEAIVIAPYVYHSIPYSSENLGKYAISFSFPGDLTKTPYEWIAQALYDKPFFALEQQKHVAGLFEQIFREAHDARSGWMINVRCLVHLMLCELARAISTGRETQAFAEKEVGESRRRVEQVERFISDNVSLPLPGGTLANFMHLSSKQLNRDIKQERGMTLRELVDSIKITEAKRLLSDVTLTQERVGRAIGFLDVSSFNRFFKRMTGSPPSVYRRMYAKQTAEQLDMDVPPQTMEEV